MPRTALIRLLLVGVLLVTLSIFLEPGSLATMLYSYDVVLAHSSYNSWR